MKLSKEIDKLLERNKKKLSVTHDFHNFSVVLRKVLKKYDVTEVTVDGIFDTSVYVFGGEYDTETNEISLNLWVYNSDDDYISINEDDWNTFKFNLTQTLVHEMIHQYQNIRRENSTWIKHYLIEPKGPMHKLSERVYLSDVDEVDAYSHDLAMEIKFYYPNESVNSVLNKIRNKKMLSTYKLYNNAFRTTDWFNIRKVLLKKTYKWLV